MRYASNFRGAKRANETPASPTDPQVQTYRQNPVRAAKQCFAEYVLIENCNSLVDAALFEPSRLVFITRVFRRKSSPDCWRSNGGCDDAY